MKNALEGFFAAIDTPGGHICLSLVLIMMGFAFGKYGEAYGKELMVGGFAILTRSMMGQNGKGLLGGGENSAKIVNPNQVLPKQ